MLKKGSTVSFRIPKHTDEKLLNYLNTLKQEQGRNFSSVLAANLLKSLEDGLTQRERKVITLPIPSTLTQDECDWLNHPQNIEILIKFIVQAFNKNVDIPYTALSEQHIERINTTDNAKAVSSVSKNFIFSQMLK
ncbi:hypothetical protein SAMN05880501_101152 [Ureibacillus xyleni]|uniref:Uncharacterized protein n=1 Tax=Ureibacillus xyleni TaxID=614648 RepID=A0A285RDD0_9BACL|nr:hypothetical protein [Ureibacillus xyleni]SOB90387.1 hypothetical protein SAMN05880501_101152 [Ureibacillus xyleni]